MTSRRKIVVASIVLLALVGTFTLWQILAVRSFEKSVAESLRQRGKDVPAEAVRGYPKELLLYEARRKPTLTIDEVESFIVEYETRRDYPPDGSGAKSIIYDFSVGWLGALRSLQLVLHFKQDASGVFRLSYICESWSFWWDEYLVEPTGVRRL